MQVSLSHAVMPMVKMVARGFTTAADAYLTPHIMRYLATFMRGFDEGLKHVQVLFMQSDGGLSHASHFSGDCVLGRCRECESTNMRTRAYNHLHAYVSPGRRSKCLAVKSYDFSETIKPASAGPS